jgi:hypothetical protein
LSFKEDVMKDVNNIKKLACDHDDNYIKRILEIIGKEITPGCDYSPDEQPIFINDKGTIRQKIDLDGSPIWCRTITGSITAPPNQTSDMGIALEGVKNICKCDGWWAYNTQGDKRMIFLSANKIWSPDEYEWDLLIECASHDVKYFSFSVQDRVNAPFQMYMEYTKIL